MNEETREEQIARWEGNGWIVKDCVGCEDFYLNPKHPSDVFAPSHKASPKCESGGHPHCTCSTCW